MNTKVRNVLSKGIRESLQVTEGHRGQKGPGVGLVTLGWCFPHHTGMLPLTPLFCTQYLTPMGCFSPPAHERCAWYPQDQCGLGEIWEPVWCCSTEAGERQGVRGRGGLTCSLHNLRYLIMVISYLGFLGPRRGLTGSTEVSYPWVELLDSKHHEPASSFQEGCTKL